MVRTSLSSTFRKHLEKKMPPGSRSRAWKYFTRSSDSKSATCDLCDQRFVYKGMTSNLRLKYNIGDTTAKWQMNPMFSICNTGGGGVTPHVANPINSTPNAYKSIFLVYIWYVIGYAGLLSSRVIDNSGNGFVTIRCLGASPPRPPPQKKNNRIHTPHLALTITLLDSNPA